MYFKLYFPTLKSVALLEFHISLDSIVDNVSTRSDTSLELGIHAFGT